MFISTMAVQFSPTNCMQFMDETNRNHTFFSTLDDQELKDNPVLLTRALRSKTFLKKLAIIMIANKVLKEVFAVAKNKSSFYELSLRLFQYPHDFHCLSFEI